MLKCRFPSPIPIDLNFLEILILNTYSREFDVSENVTPWFCKLKSPLCFQKDLEQHDTSEKNKSAQLR